MGGGVGGGRGDDEEDEEDERRKWRWRWRRWEEGNMSHSIISTSLAWRLAVRSRSSPTCSSYLSCARRHSG
eukprot:6387895-Pyramimonas_sp.AAC.1